MTHPWQYDEIVQVGVDYLNEREVRVYDQNMQRLRNISEETEEIIKVLGVSKESLVWEIGTGTGESAVALSRACKQVYATDVSSTMLQYAGNKAEKNQIANITFEMGGFLSGFHPPFPVDSIISQFALHHLPDFWKNRALSIIADRLKPKGRFYLRDVVFPSDRDDYDQFFSDLITETRVRAGDKMAQETILHIKEEYSTLDWILEGLIERNGLKIIKKDVHGFLMVYVCEK